MSITAVWDLELESTVNVQVIGQWTWEDFYDVLQEVSVPLDRADQPVHVLIDLTRAGPLPGGPLSHLKRVIGRTHPHLGHIVFCRASPFLNAMVDIISQFYPDDAHRFHYVTEREHGRALLRAHSESHSQQPASRLLASTRFQS